MNRQLSRYVETNESVTLPETATWLEQSNFFNSLEQSVDFVDNPVEQNAFKHGFIEKDVNGDEEGRRILLAITVEVEDGHLEYIEIRDGDSAEAAATNFCQTHLLPEKYVAPLTEHIVQEVHRISKVDKSIRFASQDGMVYTDEAGTEIAPEEANVQSVEKTWNDLDYNFDSDKEQQLSSKGNVNRGSSERKLSTKALSESLLSPTFTSLAKSQTSTQIEKRKERRSKQLSERAKAVYMRLYGEFLRQKQRIEEEKRWCQEQYKQRIERDKPTISKRTRRIMRLRGRAAKQFRNYGELLYQEGMNKEEERQRMIQRKLQEDEEKELRYLTLKPEISKLAKQIKREDGPVWERLLQERPRHDLQGLRQEVWESKFMECTFRPRINQRLEDEDLQQSRFDQLFWDAENRRRRQAEYVQWYPEGVTFHPVINRQHKGLGTFDELGRYQKGNVFDRLMQYAVKLAEKKKMLQELQGKCFRSLDLSTGQELFRPQTGRKPLAERNAAALPIGEFLYQQKFELENKKKSMAAKDWKERKELANGHYVGQRSQQLLNRLRERKLLKLFKHLDKDRDGFVDLDPSELRHLPEEVVSDISNFKNLGNLNRKHLAFRDFLKLMSNVQRKGNPASHLDQRCTKKTHLDSEKFSFQFKMDRYSRSLANRKRRFSTRRQWYKMILMDRANWLAKVESLRKEKQKQELAECTFRPAIHSSTSRSHLRLSDGSNNHANPRMELQNATVVEKELQEVHGFIFQEATMQKNVSMEKSNGESPLGLLQSFKNMVRTAEQSAGVEVR